jgi:hypothetical protein
LGAGALALPRDKEYVHGAPTCVILNTMPAAVSEPDRGELELFCETVYPTAPSPVPD